MLIRSLERSDVRDGFSCGDLSIDRYLREFAWQNQARYRLSVTYVAVDSATRRIFGFVTLSAATLNDDQRGGVGIPQSFSGSVPALRVGFLAVDRRLQGKGLGRELLAHGMRIAIVQSKLDGCVAMVVDAVPEAEGFYRRHGFTQAAMLEGAMAARPRRVSMMMSVGRIQSATS